MTDLRQGTVPPATPTPSAPGGPRRMPIPPAPPTTDKLTDNDPGQTFVFTIVIGTTTGNKMPPTGLGFRARCIIVSNWSNQWLWVKSAQDWVPPFVGGYRLLLEFPTAEGEADVSSAGVGGSQAGASSGQNIVITWCERVVLSTAYPLQTTTRATP